MQTTLQELIQEFENIKETKCKTLQEMVFFDGVLAIIEGKYIEKEKNQIQIIVGNSVKIALLEQLEELSEHIPCEVYTKKVIEIKSNFNDC